MTIELPAGVPDTEISEPFLSGMIFRMAMSFFKYGAVADAYPHRVSALDSMRLRLDKYQQTGNLEHLIDAANYAMIEFMCPSISGATFTPTDTDGSPGRVWKNGAVTCIANTVDRENARLGGSSRETKGGFYSREGD